MQDMIEGMRKVVKKEKDKDVVEDDKVEVIESDKTKVVKEVKEMLKCPGCNYTTANKQYMRNHMKQIMVRLIVLIDVKVLFWV